MGTAVDLGPDLTGWRRLGARRRKPYIATPAAPFIYLKKNAINLL
jgi:hypothetical protein